MATSNQPYGPPPEASLGRSRQSTDGFAVASLILGILWLGWLGSALAVIFGHVALSRIKRTGAAGRGLAIAGLVLGYVGVATALIFALIALSAAGNDSKYGASTPRAVAGGPTQPGPGIGTPVRDGSFEFTVTKLTTASMVGDQYFGKQAQGEFLMVHVTVRNIGTESQTFSGDDQQLLASGGRQFTADSDAATYLENSRSLYEEINPGNQVSGVVIFDVPKGTTPASIELHDSPFSGGAKVALG
jgi:hypothetical protein